MKYLLDQEETDRLQFRLMQPSDFELWLPFYEDPKSTMHWKADYTSPVAECEKWYAKQFKRYENDKGGMNALLDKRSGEFIGHCGLLLQEVDGTGELEIGYAILPKHWGKGYATEAAIKCKDHAFQNRFSDSLISIISLSNTPSEKVALKNGMTIDSSTVYHDNKVNIFRINREDWMVK
ncbi:MAG: GNAT family N-acetyltransferase [Flavobacteriaceae bacterium]|nr:GNAT family N-acetyltransferase [Flavobacteriaceae bacterium]